MSIIHADNYSIYGVNTAFMTNGIYAAVNATLVTDPDGLSSGRVLSCVPSAVANNTVPFRYTFQNGGTSIIGSSFRHWVNKLPDDNSGKHRFRIKDVSNNVVAYLWFTSTGQVAVSLTGGATYTSATPAITANGWYHIEWKHRYYTGTNVDFEVRIEGVQKLSETGVACTGLQPAQYDIARAQTSDTTMNLWVKDFVLWDGLGTENNDFLGSVLVTTLAVNGDVLAEGESLEWLPSTGSNDWSILDNVPPVDTIFMSGGYNPLPRAYVGTLTNLPDETTSVKAIMTFVRAAKTDGGDGSLQVSLISHPDDVTPATVAGSDRPITVGQTYWRDVFEQDPYTGAPWLPQSVNDVHIKINRTT